MPRFLVVFAALIVNLLAPASQEQTRQLGLHFEVQDAQGKPIACRIHVTDSAGRPQHSAGLPFWHDHFVCDGSAVLQVVAGRYRYEIERGPEYRPVTGTIELSQDQTVTAHLDRIADLGSDGWYSGDLHVHRPLKDMALLMGAEDLHVAPNITWWNRANSWTGQELPKAPVQRVDGGRFCDVMAGEDERGGGALLFFGLQRPLEITTATREHPSGMRFISEARQMNKDVWIDIEKPFWWDVPLWLSSGQVDSIGVANNHMQRSGMLGNEAWGRARDRQRLPDPLGNGYWTQEIYYQILNCGLRLPPSAGSASGVLPNPVGYNRVYVHVDGELEYDRWWRHLKAGRCFVTNGPLLICKAQGQFPGHVFRSDADRRLELKLEISLVSNDRVRRVEIIKNGRVDRTIETNEAVSQQRAASVSFTESGWFLVRAIAENPHTFRFACTAPFYVEMGQQTRRISKASTQFFLDWVIEREKQIRDKVSSPAELREVLGYHDPARRYWEELLRHANAE